MDLNTCKLEAIQQQNSQAGVLLQKTDWYVTRKIEKSIEIPTNVSTYRDSVRTVCNQRCDLINACDSIEAVNLQVTTPASVPGVETGTTISIENGMPDWPTEVN